MTYRGINGVEYSSRIKPAKIELAGKVAHTYDEANMILLVEAVFFVNSGKAQHDFRITFEDGLEYEGRFDLEPGKPDLARWVRAFVEWCAWSPKSRSLLKPEQIEAAKRMLANYELGQ